MIPLKQTGASISFPGRVIIYNCKFDILMDSILLREPKRGFCVLLERVRKLYGEKPCTL